MPMDPKFCQFSFSELQQVIVPHFGLLNYLSVGRSLNRGCTTPTQHPSPPPGCQDHGGGTYSIPLSNISGWGTHCAATNVQVGVGGVGGTELNYLLRCAHLHSVYYKCTHYMCKCTTQTLARTLVKNDFFFFSQYNLVQ